MSAIGEVVVYSACWAMFGVGSGWVISRIPGDRFVGDTSLTRIRRFEYRGRWYDRRLRLRTWKDRLPEAGALFGGASKSSMTGFGRVDLEAFAAETRRAEWVHWANIAFGATFFAWRQWNIGLVMLLFGVVLHLPFVMVQRYNRARIAYLLDRPATTRRDRGASGPAPSDEAPLSHRFPVDDGRRMR